MNEPPPLRNQCKLAPGGAACGRATGWYHARPPADCKTHWGARNLL